LVARPGGRRGRLRRLRARGCRVEAYIRHRFDIAADRRPARRVSPRRAPLSALKAPAIGQDGGTIVRQEARVKFVHTNVRVRDIDASLRFYEALGFERRGRLQFESAYNIYLGLPGDGDTLELTVNVGREEPYDLGDGYGHVALEVDDLDGLLESLAAQGIEPEKPPYAPGGREEFRICFVADPDGYRIELIDGEFDTPQDPDQ
jgi:lactoylglutathione lyase